MFRLFLLEKTEDGGETTAHTKTSLPSKQYRNRRVYERFNMEAKHLTMLNDQDIFVVHDVSEGGFCCEVSPRSIERLKIGDAYKCKIRYARDSYVLQAKVSWKSEKFVGFALVNENPKVVSFLERLVDPMKIGSSLKQVEESVNSFTPEKNLKWFHGDLGSELFIWFSETGDMNSWRLEHESSYLMWKKESGLESGTLETQVKDWQEPWRNSLSKDVGVDAKKKQFALDVFMVLNFEQADALIDTLGD